MCEGEQGAWSSEEAYGRDIRDVQTRKLLYTALARPLLEYSSVMCVVTLLSKTSQTDREHSEACH